MKKIFIGFMIVLSLLFSGMSFHSTYAADCSYDESSQDPLKSLDKCIKWTSVVQMEWAGLSAIQLKISKWVTNIAFYLGLFAVGAIVYGWLQMTLSAGEDEKIKKSKDIIKWWILGFLAVVFAWVIIKAVIKIMYWI
mgnify:FL=1